MIIGVDVDEVVRDLMGNILKIYNSGRNKKVKLSDVTDWELSCMPEISRDKKRFFYGYAKELFGESKPVKGAIEGLKKIKGEGHKIWLVTSQLHNLEGYTLDWCKFNKVPYDGMLFLSDKSCLPVDFMIDDNPKNLTSYGLGALLYSKPWNKDSDITRVRNWDDICGRIL